MRTEAAACAARSPQNPPVRPAGARFVRLGLHLIALWLSCSTACELWTALRSHHNACAGRSWQAVEQPSRSTIRCSPSLTKRAPAGRTGGFLGARAAHAAASVRMREGAATCRGLQWLSAPHSTGFRSATCPLSQAGHCAARGSRAHHRADQLADWPRSAVRFPIICSNHELSYTLLARARQSFELCSHFKSLPPVSDRELSADLTWRAHRRKPEFPALGLGTQSTRVQGERGV